MCVVEFHTMEKPLAMKNTIKPFKRRVRHPLPMTAHREAVGFQVANFEKQNKKVVLNDCGQEGVC